MAFTNNPLNPLDRIRLAISDTDTENSLIADQWYQYYLDINEGNEKKTAIQIAKTILAQYTGYTREREGMVEVYGNEMFNQYLKWLKALISDPSLGLLSAPMPYAGGISKSDFCNNNLNIDNIRPWRKPEEDCADNSRSYPDMW